MEISRLSGISVGSIYHRFPDKTAIFLAIHEAYRKARIEQIDEAIARQKRAIQSAVDVLSFHVGIVFDAARNDQIYLRLVERQRISNPLVNDLQLQWDDDFCKKLLSLYLPHKKQIKHPDLEQAIRYLHHTLRGVTLWSILPSPSPHQFLNVDQEDFQEQAYRMSAMYLGIKVSSTRARAAP